MLFSGRIRLVLLVLAVVGVGIVLAMEFTGWHQLEAVTLNDEAVKDWDKQFGLSDSGQLFKQPLNQVATKLLDMDNTVRVDIEYDPPNALHINTNRFEPVAFILDRSSGRMYGLNHQGRVVPTPPNHVDWEHPVLTGVRINGLFELCSDPRVSVLVEQLEILADGNRVLYRLIDEIDLSSEDFSSVIISGMPYRLRIDAGALHEQLVRFVQFLENYQPDVTGAKEFDLRFDDMIVEACAKERRGS